MIPVTQCISAVVLHLREEHALNFAERESVCIYIYQ